MKFTDTQLVLLSAASQRDDHAVELAPNLKGGAAHKVVGKLLTDETEKWRNCAIFFTRVESDLQSVLNRTVRSADQLLQTLGRYAADPELNFSWYDAAVLSQRIRSLRSEGVEDLDVSPTEADSAVPRNRLHRRAA